MKSDQVHRYDDDAAEDVNLGACCGCGTTDGVRNVVCLPHLAPTRGKGWGCLVCGLPQDGAIAVLCDGCTDPLRVERVCDGYPSEGKRVPFEEPFKSTAFTHDRAAHERDFFETSMFELEDTE